MKKPRSQALRKHWINIRVAELAEKAYTSIHKGYHRLDDFKKSHSKRLNKIYIRKIYKGF